MKGNNNQVPEEVVKLLLDGERGIMRWLIVLEGDKGLIEAFEQNGNISPRLREAIAIMKKQQVNAIVETYWPTAIL